MKAAEERSRKRRWRDEPRLVGDLDRVAEILRGAAVVAHITLRGAGDEPDPRALGRVVAGGSCRTVEEDPRLVVPRPQELDPRQLPPRRCRESGVPVLLGQVGSLVERCRAFLVVPARGVDERGSEADEAARRELAFVKPPRRTDRAAEEVECISAGT